MSDTLVESVYDIVNRQDGERDRVEVARAARLAAEYREMQLKRKRTQRAIEKRAEERKALGGAGRDQQPDGNAPVCLQGAPAGQQERDTQ